MVDGKTGILVNDDKGWVDGLSALITDNALRSELSTRALREVKANHNLDYTVDKWAETFKNVITTN
jgi:glycosyltransferase involved in cell wall biosynthesis